ncbi:PHB depolymerase family esterase [Pseudonocardia sp. WMMC193]|uniref:alpha/beta hydrolase family esterase n=1 Tax=Pseudonocardia sp. WMMC193 TaxID=2911965 RepID=UPI001F1B3969|nr:PHB depolymerase family esterase [Pseudonocardia sp. WMMC193]MCF7553222.1 polyhydroxybutyrate depolymerase [Pseudonocardia sp. WMMC193]
MRRLLPLLLLLAACAPAPPAPAPAPPAPAPGSTVTLTRPEGARQAIVVRPSSAGAEAPLVLVLHGSGGTAQEMQGLGFDPLAARDGVVTAYPQGLDGTWNAGGCCGSAVRNGVDDVGYLTALVADLVAQDGVDPHRVYAVGFSNGAMMSYTWACAGGALAGIGPVAGALTGPCPRPAPVSVVALAGTADDRVRIEGRPDRGWASLDATLAPFVAGCDAPVTRTAITSWACPGGRTVTREILDGQGHSWPDSATAFLWERLIMGHTGS